jgi:predicted nuclease of predicted toxin-antitoxin system
MARLLLDQNLSHRLVAALDDLFPQSMHVRDVGLSRAGDLSVWAFAKEANLTILTKDGDFNQMSFVYGQPPKVVWLRAGNCTTERALAVIRREAATISEFIDEAEEALLIVDARA